MTFPLVKDPPWGTNDELTALEIGTLQTHVSNCVDERNMIGWRKVTSTASTSQGMAPGAWIYYPEVITHWTQALGGDAAVNWMLEVPFTCRITGMRAAVCGAGIGPPSIGPNLSFIGEGDDITGDGYGVLAFAVDDTLGTPAYVSNHYVQNLTMNQVIYPNVVYHISFTGERGVSYTVGLTVRQPSVRLELV